jgi:hypothetical protein
MGTHPIRLMTLPIAERSRTAHGRRIHRPFTPVNALSGTDVDSGAPARDNQHDQRRRDQQMFAKLKAAWERLVGPGGGEREGPPAAAVEYNGYRIRPAPFKNNGGYQTAGSIEKDSADGVREHRFIRADAYPSREDAINFTISKAKQIIDLQGDRIFEER